MKFKEKFFELLPLLIIINTFTLIFYLFKPKIEFLYYYIPFILILNILLIIISIFLNFKNIYNAFSLIRPVYWFLLIVIVISGFILRSYIAPYTHRVYFDEDLYLNIAQNIVANGKAILCDRGTPIQCYEGILNKQPNGLSVALSVVFLIFGISESVASSFMIFTSSFSLILIFLVVYLLFKEELIGLFSALLLALNPISIIWAPTITAESLFVFSSLLTLFALYLFLSYKNTYSMLFFVSSLAFSLQLRPETPLFVLSLLPFLIKESVNKKIIVGAVLFFILVSPYAFHINYFKNESWGYVEGNKISTKFVPNNLNVNGKFFLTNERFPLLFTILAFLGLIYLTYKKEFLKLLSLIIWFCSFFIIYLLFYAGSFDYGVDVRFSQTLIVPIFILGGIGSFFLSEILNKFFKNKLISKVTVGFLVIFSFLPFINLVSAVTEESYDARTDHDFALNLTKKFGTSCTIFTNVPSMFLVNGNNALQTWYSSNSKIVDNMFINSTCVLFHEGYWCINYRPFRDTICKELKENFNLGILGRVAVKDLNYTIYRISRK